MAIIVSQNNQNARRIEESSFELEDNLQEYVINNPEIIPLYDVQSDARLFVAAREFATQTGPIDALGFDESGNIYIIETKMFRNADKRRVVAQALDYGASIWRHATDFEAFLAQLDTHTNKQFGASFKDQYQEFFEMEDTTDSMAAIRQNLDEGNIKFVVLMDSLDDRLKDLILYVNQNSKFDIYAVDFEYYKHDQFEIVIPKLYGTEVKKEVVTKNTAQRRKWTEGEFLDEVNKLELANRQATLKLVQWAKSNADTITFGTGVISGSLNPKFNHIGPRSFVHIITNGDIQISYGYLDPDVDLMKKLRDTLAEHVSFDKITDIPDEKLPRSEWLAFPSNYVAENVDEIIAALSEFIKGGES